MRTPASNDQKRAAERASGKHIADGERLAEWSSMAAGALAQNTIRAGGGIGRSSARGDGINGIFETFDIACRPNSLARVVHVEVKQ